MVYKLAFHPDARGEWDALDGSIRKPLKTALERRLANPRTPGSTLSGDLHGYYKIKLLKGGVRLVYTLDEERGRLVVVAIGRRVDAEAYIAAASRAVRQVRIVEGAGRSGAKRERVVVKHPIPKRRR